MKRFVVERVLPVFFRVVVPFGLALVVASALIDGGKSFTLFPGEHVYAGTFGDFEEAGGRSTVDRFNRSRDRIGFSYTLRSGYIAPYAGFWIKRGDWMDFAPFDTMRIRIAASRSRSVMVLLFVKIPGYTTDTDVSSFLRLQKEIRLQNDREEYTIRLADFSTPEWWHERELGEDDTRLVRDMRAVYTLSIQSGMNEPFDVPDTILVYEIVLFADNLQRLVVSMLVFAFYVIGLLVFFGLRRFRRRGVNKIGTSPAAGRNPEAERIIACIGEQYHRSDLSLGAVAHATGISAATISSCLKTGFALSFPRYLNAIRLAEAKRLLKETDLLVSEIAFRVGFNNVPHFNRMFRKSEAMSPKDFRKSNRG